MKHSRFSPRLRFVLFWPLLAAVALAAPLLWVLATGPLEKATATLLLDAVEILWPQAAQALDRSDAKVQESIRNLAAASSIRMTLIDESGRVMAESSLTLDEIQAMENHGSRPEVKEAFATGHGIAVRQSTTTGVSYAYAARSFIAQDDRVFVLRLARPLEQVRFLRRNLTGAITMALVTGLLLLAPTAWWLNRRLFRPLKEIIDGAQQLAAGDLASRVTVPAGEELATLSESLNRLADKVEVQIKLLAAERDHLREIVASMSEGVLVTDRAGRVRLTNPALLQIFGFDREIEDETGSELIRQPTLGLVIREVLEGAEARAAELDLPEPNRRNLSLLASPLPGGQGVVVVVRDMTQTLRQAEIRRDLVANVSHELKTPLTAIRGYAETLRDGALEDPAVAPRFVGRVLEQCERLEALLRDLLTLSRLEQHDERPASSELLDLQDLARRAVEVLTPRAREHGVELVLTAEETSVLRVRGARSECEKMLLNLIENGVKYNRPGGEVRISLTIEGDAVVIAVADTGIGIPQQALERIFERFYRVDKGRARDQGGTGLGLSIVKHAARVLGGRVEVESALGEGSVFRIRLPVAGAER